jgi:starvation-inducible outer membrane lipoprotein
MKNLLYYLIAITISLAAIGCKSEPPSVRVHNEHSEKANVQIKTTTTTINQNNVTSGATTNYQDISEGSTEVTAEIQNEPVSPTTTFDASNDNNYTLVIVNSNPPTLRVDPSGK